MARFRRFKQHTCCRRRGVSDRLCRASPQTPPNKHRYLTWRRSPRFGMAHRRGEMDPCAMVWDETNRYQLSLRPLTNRSAPHVITRTASFFFAFFRTAAAGANVHRSGSGRPDCRWLLYLVRPQEICCRASDSDLPFSISSAVDGSATKDYPVESFIHPAKGAAGHNYWRRLHFAGDTYASIWTLRVKRCKQQDDRDFTEGATATVDGEKLHQPLRTLSPQHLRPNYSGRYSKRATICTRATADSTIPCATISDSSKKLAKDMLWKWYDTLESMQEFGSYWQIFMATS